MKNENQIQKSLKCFPTERIQKKQSTQPQRLTVTWRILLVSQLISFRGM